LSKVPTPPPPPSPPWSSSSSSSSCCTQRHHCVLECAQPGRTVAEEEHIAKKAK
jgi:hypothetical protein